ncbi:PLEKHD1 (predicted) [Pycnogonum litorale]
MSTRSFDGDENFHVCARVQMSGTLFKRPFGAHHSNKWSKKFFVVKEGFLLYYNENEKKQFEKKGYLNMHPKGVLPLGGCSIDSSSESASSMFHIIYIRSEDFTTGFVCLGVESDFEKEKWMTALQEASRITLKNAKLGEDLIREHENRGLQLFKEKQDCFDKLQEETMALREEIDKNEELIRMKIELDNEKKKLENMVDELKTEHGKIRSEYESTVETMKQFECEKRELHETTKLLHETLAELATEREETITALQSKEQENQNLSKAAEDLQHNLLSIEEETNLILQERGEVERRFVENEVMSRILEEEKAIFSAQANHLLSSLNDLMSQKESSEIELKEEILARIQTERRLYEAEKSLLRLEDAVKNKTNKLNRDDSFCDRILPDVKNLKKFFELAALEAKIDANMPMIMKNAVVARKAFVHKQRAAKFQRERLEKAKTLGVEILDEDESLGSTLRRSYSTAGRIKNRPTSVAQLRRSLSTRMSKINKNT